MPQCELCEINEAIGKYMIPLSHPFSDTRTEVYLCKFCVSDLMEKGVKLERVG